MDDPALFEQFLTNLCGVTLPRVLNEVTGFIPSFRALLSSSNEDVQNFVTTTHASNSGRASNAKIVIPSGAILNLKALRFELSDRNRCNTLPDSDMLTALTSVDLNFLRIQKTQAVEDAKSFDKLSSLPEIKVPKLTESNYEAFDTAFQSILAKTIGMNVIPITYILRKNEVGDYEHNWETRLKKLENCLVFSGNNYRQDNEAVYSLYAQYIGTESIGSNVVNRYIHTKVENVS